MSRPPKIFSCGRQWATGPTWYGWRRGAKNLEGRGRVAGSGRRAPGAALGAGAAQGAQAGTAPAGRQGLRAVSARPWRRPLERPRIAVRSLTGRQTPRADAQKRGPRPYGAWGRVTRRAGTWPGDRPTPAEEAPLERLSDNVQIMHCQTKDE
jgi:hypothetical protein